MTKPTADFKKKRMIKIEIPECLALTISNIIRGNDSVKAARVYNGEDNMNCLAQVIEDAYDQQANHV